MSRGFITLGINTDKDRIFHSYGLACSIKNSDPTAEICLVVDKGKSDEVSKDYLKMFFSKGWYLPYRYFWENHFFDLIRGIDTHSQIPKNQFKILSQ